MTKYKISVVVPVYNAEKYLEATIKSVLNQSIGFKNIQLILINDGSKDNSFKICEKYKNKYPENIVYVEKKNEGVSVARNVGIDLAKSKYILFLDSDDLMSKKSFSYLYDYMEKEKNKIDFVISRVRFFEKIHRWHYMDFRFKSNKIANIDEDIKYCQYHSSGFLMKTDVVKKIKYDKNVKYGEDMQLMAQILLNKGKFGIERRSILYYRMRKNQSSAVQGQQKDISWYLNTLDAFKMIFSKVEKKYRSIPLYYQFFIMNSIRERFGLDYKFVKTILKDKYDEYINKLFFLLSKISDIAILMQKRLDINYILYALNLNKAVCNLKVSQKGILFDDKVIPLNEFNLINILSVSSKNDKLYFDIKINNYILDVNNIAFTINNELYFDKKKYLNSNEYFDLYGKKITFNNEYTFSVPLVFNKKYKLIDNVLNINLPFIISMKVNNISENSGYFINKKLIIIFNENTLEVRKCNYLIKFIFKLKNILYKLKVNGLMNILSEKILKIR